MYVCFLSLMLERTRSMIFCWCWFHFHFKRMRYVYSRIRKDHVLVWIQISIHIETTLNSQTNGEPNFCCWFELHNIEKTLTIVQIKYPMCKTISQIIWIHQKVYQNNQFIIHFRYKIQNIFYWFEVIFLLQNRLVLALV